MISTAVIFSALELGCIYALVALALFLSFRVLNIADMTTDGSFTLGCAVSGRASVQSLCAYSCQESRAVPQALLR